VSSHAPAKDLGVLRRHGVTHVLSLIDVAPAFPDDVAYLTIVTADANGYDMAQHFDATWRFIDGAMSAGGGAVLVHCGAGISRAPTVAAAYLVRRLGVPAHAALAMIRAARPCASPNKGFTLQLQRYAGDAPSN
jgi:protein-tyrosine phosphatase